MIQPPFLKASSSLGSAVNIVNAERSHARRFTVFLDLQHLVFLLGR